MLIRRDEEHHLAREFTALGSPRPARKRLPPRRVAGADRAMKDDQPAAALRKSVNGGAGFGPSGCGLFLEEHEAHPLFRGRAGRRAALQRRSRRAGRECGKGRCRIFPIPARDRMRSRRAAVLRLRRGSATGGEGEKAQRGSGYINGCGGETPGTDWKLARTRLRALHFRLRRVHIGGCGGLRRGRKRGGEGVLGLKPFRYEEAVEVLVEAGKRARSSA